MESSSSKPVLTATRNRPRHERPLTPAELGDYLNGLNSKDPNRLMDAVSRGSLVQGLILATVATVVLLLACTIVPYLLESQTPAAKTAVPAPEAQAAAPAPAAESQPAATASPGKTADTATVGQPVVNKKVLGGVDEVKQSDPNVNPLDNKIDDLFDKTR